MTEAVEYKLIKYEVRGPVAVITMNRPESRNALSTRLYLDVVAGIEAANADDEIGAIVWTSTGPVFCAGADFKDKGDDVPLDEKGRKLSVASLGMKQGNSLIHQLRHSKPSIVAVQGAAIGLGVTSILGTDIRMAAESATFSFPFVKLGTLPEFGATALLPQLIGLSKAIDLCLSAGKIDAKEALRIGLVSRVVPDADLLEAAVALGTEISGFQRERVATAKELIYANAGEHDVDTLLKRESMAFVAMFKSGIGRPSAASALQKDR